MIQTAFEFISVYLAASSFLLIICVLFNNNDEKSRVTDKSIMLNTTYLTEINIEDRKNNFEGSKSSEKSSRIVF